MAEQKMKGEVMSRGLWAGYEQDTGRLWAGYE